MTKIIDISPTLGPHTAVWPGDVPFRRDVALSIKNGDHLELSNIHTTVHIGAHTDAPSHYSSDGATMDARALHYYYGPCQVMKVNIEGGERILPKHLTSEIIAPRLLLHTGTFPDPNTFNEDFASLSPELVQFAHENGVCLLGIDTPSVDPCHDSDLCSHHAIAKLDMAILEGVVLEHVTSGLYTLVALPLKLAHCDASPVRAVLLQDA